MTVETPILDHLIETMTEVVESNKPLFMREFFKGHDDVIPKSLHDLTIHTCETPACILGYSVINNPPIKLAEDDECWDLAYALETELGTPLAESIYMSDGDSRQFADYTTSHLLDTDSVEELHRHPHLNEDHDDPAIALDYLLKVKELIHAQ